MKYLIIAVTPDEQLRHFIGTRKVGIIPKDILQQSHFQRNDIKFSVSSFKPTTHNRVFDLSSHISSITIGADGRVLMDGVIMLVDEEYTDIISEFREAFFVARLDRSLGGKNYQNYLGMVLAKSLKNFSFYSERFNDLKYRKTLLLPFCSFKARELTDLKSLLTDRNQSAGFGQSLDEKIGQLMSRQCPKPARRHKSTYIRDDNRRYFEYGHEHHARVEKVIPPHHHCCFFNSEFRFGRSYDALRHFNVSEERPLEQISGDFLACHGQTIGVPPRTHINIFPNGFVA